jgi:hypothetical protein
MKFEDAIKKSIRSFMDGNMPKGMMEQMESEPMYTPEYYDELEKDMDTKEAKDEV